MDSSFQETIQAKEGNWNLVNNEQDNRNAITVAIKLF